MSTRADADTVLMIRPAEFGCDPQAAASNAFQRAPTGARQSGIPERAAEEVQRLAAALARHGIRVILEHDLVAFETRHGAGRPIYHTNVLLALGPDWAVVSADVIAQRRERAAIVARLSESGRNVIEIPVETMRAFGANVLSLRGAAGAVIALSTRALDALPRSARERLGERATLVATPLTTIEDVGGGSARCLLCEVHLPRTTGEGSPS